MTKTNGSFKNGFFFILLLIATVGFSQNSPCLDRKTTGYTVAEISSAYKAGEFNCDEKQHAIDVAVVIQADADAQGVKFKPEYGGGPAKFDGTQPGIMDSILKYSIEMDGNFVSNYGWDSEVGKHTIYSRDRYSGEKGIYFDYNRTPYFEGNYKPARYSSNICANIQAGEKQTVAKTTTTTSGNTTTTTTTEKTPEGDVNVTVTNTISTGANTNTNTNSLPATPPSNMLPTQSYTPGSSYCVADGQYYPQGNSQGQWCQTNNGQMVWIDWANFFLNVADLAVDIWSLWKLYDLAGTPETVVPPTVYNYYIEEGDEITNNYYGDDTDTGNDDPDLPTNGGGSDLGSNGKFASQSGKTSNPFGGDVVKTESAVAVNQNAGNIFGGSVSAGSPNVEVNQNAIAGNIFGAGVSTPNTGINTGAVLNDGIASVVPLNTSTGISNPFGAGVSPVGVDNLSGLTTTGINGIQTSVNLGSNQIILNPNTNLPVTNVIGQNGAIALNGGAPAVNGIQPIQTNGVAVNGNISDGIKPITLIEQPTIAISGNQGGIDKNIVASQPQYNIGSILTGGTTTGTPGGGMILNNTGTSGIKLKSTGVGTGGLIKIK